MQASHHSSLLPEMFKHKSTKVRIFQPLVVLLDFHGTISERKWEQKVITPYVKKSLNSFLKDNLDNDQVQKCIASLKNESFEQRFRYKYDDAPIIDDVSVEDIVDPNQLANQVGDFLLWQINMKKETKDTQIIERLVWLDGFKRKQIATPLFDDVFTRVKEWHDQNHCSIYVISSIEAETLKLLFENTDKGDLNQFLDGYVSSKNTGDKLIAETYKSFYEKLNLKKEQRKASKDLKQASPSDNGQKNSLSTIKNTSNSNGNSKLSSPSSRSSSINSQSSDFVAKPILFLTDSGQEAKAASQVLDGTIYECLLVNRPGNKRIRTYYLSQFAYVEKLEDIEFV